MKIQWKPLLLCLAIPLLPGGLVGFAIRNDVRSFATLNQPPLSPPGWLFPIVWTILYACMGIASYLILQTGSKHPSTDSALKTYGTQLFFNLVWPFLFFTLTLYRIAFWWLAVLWVLIFLTIRRFFALRKEAGYLLVPYLLWVTFAGYLNGGIAILN